MVSFDKRALSLTRALREQDGGLPCVEALTLPYSKGQFEVACKAAIESKVKKMGIQNNEGTAVRPVGRESVLCWNKQLLISVWKQTQSLILLRVQLHLMTPSWSNFKIAFESRLVASVYSIYNYQCCF
jgi:hypothetical protein